MLFNKAALAIVAGSALTAFASPNPVGNIRDVEVAEHGINEAREAQRSVADEAQSGTLPTVTRAVEADASQSFDRRFKMPKIGKTKTKTKTEPETSPKTSPKTGEDGEGTTSDSGDGKTGSTASETRTAESPAKSITDSMSSRLGSLETGKSDTGADSKTADGSTSTDAAKTTDSAESTETGSKTTEGASSTPTDSITTSSDASKTTTTSSDADSEPTGDSSSSSKTHSTTDTTDPTITTDDGSYETETKTGILNQFGSELASGVGSELGTSVGSELGGAASTVVSNLTRNWVEARDRARGEFAARRRAELPIYTVAPAEETTTTTLWTVVVRTEVPSSFTTKTSQA